MSGKRKSIATGAELRGVFPALFTPLCDDDPKRLRNSIDYAKAKKIIDDLIAEGVDGLVPVGTTGQSPTVSSAQHLDFIRFAVDYVDGRVPVIAGAGSNCTRESVDLIQELLKSLGDIAVLCVTGYYNNPPQEGLAAHYETLSRETGAKIVIYNVPSRTASYLEPDTLVRLAQDKNIIGLKQAVDFRSQGRHRDDTLAVIQRTQHADFSVISGEDDGVFAIMELGGQGVITASGTIAEASRMFLKLVSAHRSGRKDEAERAQQEAMPLIRAVFGRKNPIPLGTFFNSPLFLPLVPVRETRDGVGFESEILGLIQDQLPSLRKYHPTLR
jgi:4-hydroxy-tetrahydrodipicolinate synthase